MNWEISKGSEGVVIYEPDVGTVANIPIDLADYEANAHLMAAAPIGLDLAEAIMATKEDGKDRSIAIYKFASEFIAKAGSKYMEVKETAVAEKWEVRGSLYTTFSAESTVAINAHRIGHINDEELAQRLREAGDKLDKGLKEVGR